MLTLVPTTMIRNMKVEEEKVASHPEARAEELKDPIIWTGPILASDRLIVAGSNQEALAISPYSGQILGVVEMPDAVTIAPIVANGSVYFLANDAKLIAYR